MTNQRADILSAERAGRDLASDIYHALSQPLTALECGLEVSLRQDNTVAELRARVASALETAQVLHQRLLEARALQDAGETGDTSLPILADYLLSQLREDFLLVSDSAKVKLGVNCEPAMVHGNEARLRNGFFHLFEYLLRTGPPRRTLRIRGVRTSSTVFEVKFTNDGSTRSKAVEPAQRMNISDIDLRIAQRIFQAAGGDLVLTQDGSGKIAGHVRLLLAN
jgi:hypothetical protein